MSSIIDEEAASVHTHLGIVQSTIQRMAANSAMCKGWGVALVSAILVVIADSDRPQYAGLALIPTVIFGALDAYYLALEKGFIKAYNSFIDKLHGSALVPNDLYAVEPGDVGVKQLVRTCFSLSVWPVYGMLALMTLLAWRFVL